MSLNRGQTTAPDTTASALLGMLEKKDSATEKEEKKPNLTPTQQKYLELTDEAEMRTGFGRMIQHHFPDEESAKTFLEWVKSVAELAEKKIQKASVNKSAFDTYVVRLTSEQYDILQPCKKPIPSLEGAPIDSLEKIQLKIKKVHADTEKKHEAIQFTDVVINLFPANLARCDYRRIHKILRSNGSYYLFHFQMMMKFYNNDQPFLINKEGLLKEQLHQLILKLYKQFPVHFIDAEFKNNSLLLQYLMMFAPENHIHFILDKISASALSAIFSSLACGHQTFLLTDAKTEILCKLLNKLHSGNFVFKREVLSHVDTKDWTLLHKIFYFKNKAAALAFLKCCRQEELDAAIILQDNYRETALHTAARYQDKEVFEALINKCSAVRLTACCMFLAKGNLGVLAYALSYQPPETIAKLIKEIFTTAVLFLVENLQERGIRLIAGYLAFEPSFNDANIIDKIFACREETFLVLATSLKQIWEQGHDLPMLVVKNLLANHKSRNMFKADEQAYLQAFIQFENSHPQENKSNNSGRHQDKKPETRSELVLADGSTFSFEQSIDPQRLFSVAVKNGVQNSLQSRKLRKQITNPCLASFLNILEKNHLLFRGTCKAPVDQQDKSFVDQMNRIMQVTQQGNLLLKIITQQNWNDFVKQMQSYPYRPELRKKIDKNTPNYYKFVHLSKQIVLFKNHDERKKEYKHTKKQSATLISKDLTTAVFGEHDPSRELVGLLFDKELCVIKGMFSSDKGTFQRSWVGTEQEVNDYKDQIDSCLFTDFNDFRNMVEKNPNRLNEVLAKLSRESLLAIVIVIDNEKMRSLAYDRQQYLKTALDILLPVVCYDRLNRKLRFISQDELSAHTTFILDGELLKASMESAYETMQQIKKLIHEKKWSGLNIGFPAGAKAILKLIEEAERCKSAQVSPMQIVNNLLEIKKILLAKKQANLLRRFETTRQNYDALYQAATQSPEHLKKLSKMM